MRSSKISMYKHIRQIKGEQVMAQDRAFDKNLEASHDAKINDLMHFSQPNKTNNSIRVILLRRFCHQKFVNKKNLGSALLRGLGLVIASYANENIP